MFSVAAFKRVRVCRDVSGGRRANRGPIGMMDRRGRPMRKQVGCLYEADSQHHSQLLSARAVYCSMAQSKGPCVAVAAGPEALLRPIFEFVGFLRLPRIATSS